MLKIPLEKRRNFHPFSGNVSAALPILMLAIVSSGRLILDPGPCSSGPPPRVPVLVIVGRNHHDWAVTTDALRATLELTGRVSVSVETSPQLPSHRVPRKSSDPDPEELEEYQEAQKRYFELEVQRRCVELKRANLVAGDAGAFCRVYAWRRSCIGARGEQCLRQLY
ncbi:MAG: hypothetical protein ACI8XO_000040 [Verrucomicrobiales bacterium]|jgi:hypothetical protein